jgi:hypothetical protein
MTGLLRRALVLPSLLILLAACSSTTLTGSWRNPDYQGQVRKLYIIGVAKSEIVRRIFEDEFGQQLQTRGVTTISSYKELTSPGEADQQVVAERIRVNGADSVLMARLVNRRTEEVTSPGYVSGYSSGSYSYYGNFGSYYDRRYDAIYVPPTTTQFEIVTIEANLYDTKSGKLTWSAQLETVIEADIQKMVADFVKIVTKDLQEKGLI